MTKDELQDIIHNLAANHFGPEDIPRASATARRLLSVDDTDVARRVWRLLNAIAEDGGSEQLWAEMCESQDSKDRDAVKVFGELAILSNEFGGEGAIELFRLRCVRKLLQQLADRLDEVQTSAELDLESLRTDVMEIIEECDGV